MGNKQKKTKILCYLCGKPGADTCEHIPPRSIFPKEPKGQLITVPAHYDCNHKFHEDDELFRNLIIASSTRSPEGEKAWKERVIPSWKKNPRAKFELKKRLTSAWIKDRISQALIRTPAITQDTPLVYRQIDRWTRGLFYHRFKEPMLPNLKVKVDKLSYPEQSLVPFINDFAKQGIYIKWNHVEPNVFSYTYLISEDSKNIGFAVFVFFDTEVYLGATGIEHFGSHKCDPYKKDRI